MSDKSAIGPTEISKFGNAWIDSLAVKNNGYS